MGHFLIGMSRGWLSALGYGSRAAVVARAARSLAVDGMYWCLGAFLFAKYGLEETWFSLSAKRWCQVILWNERLKHRKQHQRVLLFVGFFGRLLAKYYYGTTIWIFYHTTPRWTFLSDSLSPKSFHLFCQAVWPPWKTLLGRDLRALPRNSFRSATLCATAALAFSHRTSGWQQADPEPEFLGSYSGITSLKLTVYPWKWMGLEDDEISFWGFKGLFSGAIC